MAEEPRFIVKPSPESHFSWLRTRMSAERPLMSWVRTAISLIGFGFTIFQFLERLNTMTGAQPAEHPNAPWIFGLALIDEYKPIAGVGDRWHTPIVAVCVVLILIGFSAFGAVFWRVH
jgi:putative membrane protein